MFSAIVTYQRLSQLVRGAAVSGLRGRLPDGTQSWIELQDLQQIHIRQNSFHNNCDVRNQLNPHDVTRT